MLLNEDIFDEVEKQEIPAVEEEPIPANELTPETPEKGVDTGIANILHDLIIDEHEAIQGYNNAIANLESHPELIPIMQDIANEEMNHIGMLEVALEMLSPNAKSMDEGEAEAEEIIDSEEADPGSPVEESANRITHSKTIYEDTEKNSDGKWVNTGDNGEHGEFKTKKEADAQRKAMFANGYKG